MRAPVTVAIPVRNGGPLLRDVLAAVRAQELEQPAELLVADSGSTDGSAELARSFGATVVPVERFSHGGTRNLLMERAAGAHVAFLTQDAVPADERWLARLLAGFDAANDVALVCGPFRARAGAPVAIARELDDWFGSFAPDGAPRVDRGPVPEAPGPATFFTSANGAVARWAWERVPFPDVAYAEDQALARAVLEAGYAKVFAPGAAVIHSHEYPVLTQFRRAFDEWRALREVHGWVQPANPVRIALALQSDVRADVRALRARGDGSAPVVARELMRSLRHWSVRAAGATAGSRAERLPPRVRRWCSLERRAD
jgi:cellulose synthase/poly-beta-1,6-N-acetylglucosamine synthase-like glycosyltransferase